MVEPSRGSGGSRSTAAKIPVRPTHTWKVADFRPAGPHHAVENLPAHVVSGSIALILIVSPIVFHRAFAGMGPINILIVLAGVGVAILTLLLSTKDYHPAPRRRPSYPPGVSNQEKAEIAQLGAAYGRFRDALDSLPEGQPKNRIGFALAGTEPGDIALGIITSNAWSDSWLPEHKLEVDPLREATEIYDYLGRIAAKIAEFSAQADALRDTPVAARYRQYAEDLTTDLTAVRDRARALFAYQTDVNRLSQLLRAEHAQPQLEQDADAVLDLVAESRRHQLAAEYLRQRQKELETITDGLRELQSILNDNSTRLPTRPGRH
ncbi:hypothetical protein GCM10011575_01060 [Microlunatus endophyticus]|uniref:Uncharacterized protein n=1 Tax=Microlunatus endophyticus TaxID=1716077 RepID=A0A917S0J2_9ACTN|nr:hypothetical protein [Microlunatus endophyticus]GGL47000.1 hypothetical protein GCM10011575_01060 [Microlunatus endophyticus]